jgi:hypothetical protein
MSRPLTDSVCHVSLTMEPDVRNRVKLGKNENLVHIGTNLLKTGGFLQFCAYRWFGVFPTKNLVFF